MDIEDRQKLLAHASTNAKKIYTHPIFDLAMQYMLIKFQSMENGKTIV